MATRLTNTRARRALYEETTGQSCGWYLPPDWQPDPQKVAALDPLSLLCRPNFGRVTFREVEAWLASHGLQFKGKPMATLRDRGETIRIGYDASDDVQIVRMTRQQARAYFDGEGLPEGFDFALDLAQAEAATMDAVVVIMIAREA